MQHHRSPPSSEASQLSLDTKTQLQNVATYFGVTGSYFMEKVDEQTVWLVAWVVISVSNAAS